MVSVVRKRIELLARTLFAFQGLCSYHFLIRDFLVCFLSFEVFVLSEPRKIPSHSQNVVFAGFQRIIFHSFGVFCFDFFASRHVRLQTISVFVSNDPNIPTPPEQLKWLTKVRSAKSSCFLLLLFVSRCVVVVPPSPFTATGPRFTTAKGKICLIVVF